MKSKIYIFLTLALFPIAAAPQTKNYVGYKHKGVVFGATLPNGAMDLGGGLLSNENYGVSRFSKGKRFMLWLEKITALDEKGIPSWQVKDVLSFGKLKKNQEFLFSYSSICTQNGKGKLDLIVQAEYAPKTKTYKAINAWRANTKRERFEKISTKGIKCAYVEP